jgi:glutamate 5-kinase
LRKKTPGATSVIVVSSGAAEAGRATTAGRRRARSVKGKRARKRVCDRRGIDMELFPK